MNRLQNLIMDQPISNSVERATWWIEYVIRNKGTVSRFSLIEEFFIKTLIYYLETSKK